MEKLRMLSSTPERAVIAVGLIILLVEYLIMALFKVMLGMFFAGDGEPLAIAAFDYLDPILLIAITSPALYLLIFRPMRKQQSELERQLVELHRFQKVTVGRELRMQELVKENAALRERLAAAERGGRA